MIWKTKRQLQHSPQPKTPNDIRWPPSDNISKSLNQAILFLKQLPQSSSAATKNCKSHLCQKKNRKSAIWKVSTCQFTDFCPTNGGHRSRSSSKGRFLPCSRLPTRPRSLYILRTIFFAVLSLAFVPASLFIKNFYVPSVINVYVVSVSMQCVVSSLWLMFVFETCKGICLNVRDVAWLCWCILLFIVIYFLSFVVYCHILLRVGVCCVLLYNNVGCCCML